MTFYRICSKRGNLLSAVTGTVVQERGVAAFARPAYGIEVVSVDIRRLSLPELNRAHVFDRMTAERAKMAEQNRAAGELRRGK